MNGCLWFNMACYTLGQRKDGMATSASANCSCPLCCADAAAASIQRACAPDAAASTYAAQHMFSIYVHSAPDFEGYQEGSIFQGR